MIDDQEIEAILVTVAAGDPDGASQLLPRVYDELRDLARGHVRREAARGSLQTTALAHEAWLRLMSSKDASWENRAHFFGSAAEAMRRILVERARRRAAIKHGGGRRRVEFDEPPAKQDERTDDVVAIHDALARFEAIEPSRAAVVKLRYFAGLTIEQTADLLSISPATVSNHWTYARAWLHREMRRGD